MHVETANLVGIERSIVVRAPYPPRLLFVQRSRSLRGPCRIRRMQRCHLRLRVTCDRGRADRLSGSARRLLTRYSRALLWNGHAHLLAPATIEREVLPRLSIQEQTALR